MGQTASAAYERTREKPNPTTQATLYYFAGRGIADQIRWILAGTNISFSQPIISDRQRFLKMTERQLPFGQFPLLQIDGLEIIQSQAIIRYLARKAKLVGDTFEEELKCEMIAETIKDLVSMIVQCPFKRARRNERDIKDHKTAMLDKWNFIGKRFEMILTANGGKFLVGNNLTYVDILMAHILTWYVEELGAEIVSEMPNLTDLQNMVLSMSAIKEFIKGPNYFPLSDDEYVRQVHIILGRQPISNGDQLLAMF